MRAWRAEKIETGRLTQTARAYDLMKSILKTAIEDGLIADNPCKIKGGSLTRTGRDTTPPTDKQLEAIDERYKALVIIAAAGGLRFGEALALTTDDVIVEHDEHGEVDCVRLLVTRSVVEGAGRNVLRDRPRPTPVSAASPFGRDAEAIARHIAPLAPGALLWTDQSGNYGSQSSVNNWWWKARAIAGCPDLAFHSLRHYAGTRYA